MKRAGLFWLSFFAAAVVRAAELPTPDAAGVLVAAATGGVLMNALPGALPFLLLFVLTLGPDPSAARRAGARFAIGAAAVLAAFGVASLLHGSPVFDTPSLWFCVTAGAAAGVSVLLVDDAPHPDTVGALAALLALAGSPLVSGPALADSAGHPLFSGTVAFVAAGFAAPGVILAHLSPSWRPEPGPWLEGVRRALVVPVAGTGFWALWVAGRMGGQMAAMMAAAFAGAVIAAAWLWRRGGLRRMAAALLVIGAWVALVRPAAGLRSPLAVTDPIVSADGPWSMFSSEQAAAAAAQGRDIVVLITADGCLTSLVDKRRVFGAPAARNLLRERGAAGFVADATRPAGDTAELLRRLGRRAAPVYAVWRGGDMTNPVAIKAPVSLDDLRKALGDGAVARQ